MAAKTGRGRGEKKLENDRRENDEQGKTTLLEATLGDIAREGVKTEESWLCKDTARK